ncbi:hypothetical protein ACC712_38485, partial [Rhizobium ruizarguesonis]
DHAFIGGWSQRTIFAYFGSLNFTKAQWEHKTKVAFDDKVARCRRWHAGIGNDKQLRQRRQWHIQVDTDPAFVAVDDAD